jgi:hypothetical protein
MRWKRNMSREDKKVSMFLCLIKYHAMKKYWGVEAKLQANYLPYS